MAVARYAIIGKGGTVENIILWDEREAPTFAAGAALRIMPDDDVAIGDDFDGEHFTRPAAALHDLATVRADCMLVLDMEFRHLAASMFVDAAKREEMRTAALAGVRLIEAANTHEEVLAVSKETLATLRSFVP